MRLKLLELLKLLICRCFLSLPRLLSGTFVNRFEQRRRHVSEKSYSITSSALVRSDEGTVRPSALAVLRLIVNSNLVG